MYWGDLDALKNVSTNLKLAREGPNIVQPYEVNEERAFCYLVMELMQGGELLEFIIEKYTFTKKRGPEFHSMRLDGSGVYARETRDAS
jgi:serine/threonine protein kinase